MAHSAPELAPGTLLIAPPGQDTEPTFARTVALVVDREPGGITTAITINRPLAERALDFSALALLFVPQPDALAFWGGPMGHDPAILAEFSTVQGLEWFHLPTRQQRPFPLPNVGVVAVAEHPGPFDGRIRRARLYVGLCVWGRGQLEREVAAEAWWLAQARPDDVFTPEPATLWSSLVARFH